jgi:soluble lytic murein transglycosylase
VTYGADYLASQRNLFGDNPFVILSAYNGGPGSASAWAQLAPDDAELYVEIVRFSETRNYLRSVFELFILYEEIYATALN